MHRQPQIFKSLKSEFEPLEPARAAVLGGDAQVNPAPRSALGAQLEHISGL